MLMRLLYDIPNAVLMSKPTSAGHQGLSEYYVCKPNITHFMRDCRGGLITFHTVDIPDVIMFGFVHSDLVQELSLKEFLQ